MHNFPKASAGLCTLLLSIGASATTFTLSNVKLSDGGTLTGSFVADSAYTLYSTDVLASTNGGYVGYDYTQSPSSVNAYSNFLPNYLDFSLSTQAGNFDRLRLNFVNLTVNGGSLATTSFEQEISGGTRYVVSGSITSDAPPAPAITPEPSSLILLGTGLAGFSGAVLRRLRRKA